MNKNISIQRREVWDAEKSNLIVSLLLAVPLESLLPEERAMVFFMRNQAAPLSKMDLSLVVLGTRSIGCAIIALYRKRLNSQPPRVVSTTI